MWESDSSFRPRLFMKLLRVTGKQHLDFTVNSPSAMSFALHWTTRGFLCGGRHLGCALCKIRGSRMMAYLATRIDRTLGLVEVGAATLEQIQLIADENNGGQLAGLRLRLRRSERSQRLMAEFYGLDVISPKMEVAQLELLESIARLYHLPELEPYELFDSYSARLQEEVLSQALSQAAILSAHRTSATR